MTQTEIRNDVMKVQTRSKYRKTKQEVTFVLDVGFRWGVNWVCTHVNIPFQRLLGGPDSLHFA